MTKWLRKFWKTCGPHNEDMLGIVSTQSRWGSKVMPIDITQLFGGSGWSLAIVKTSTPDKWFDASYDREPSNPKQQQWEQGTVPRGAAG